MRLAPGCRTESAAPFRDSGRVGGWEGFGVGAWRMSPALIVSCPSWRWLDGDRGTCLSAAVGVSLLAALGSLSPAQR